jgi:hypothetical protein
MTLSKEAFTKNVLTKESETRAHRNVRIGELLIDLLVTKLSQGEKIDRKIQVASELFDPEHEGRVESVTEQLSFISKVETSVSEVEKMGRGVVDQAILLLGQSLQETKRLLQESEKYRRAYADKKTVSLVTNILASPVSDEVKIRFIEKFNLNLSDVVLNIIEGELTTQDPFEILSSLKQSDKPTSPKDQPDTLTNLGINSSERRGDKVLAVFERFAPSNMRIPKDSELNAYAVILNEADYKLLKYIVAGENHRRSITEVNDYLGTNKAQIHILRGELDRTELGLRKTDNNWEVYLKNSEPLRTPLATHEILDILGLGYDAKQIHSLNVPKPFQIEGRGDLIFVKPNEYPFIEICFSLSRTGSRVLRDLTEKTSSISKLSNLMSSFLTALTNATYESEIDSTFVANSRIPLLRKLKIRGINGFNLYFTYGTNGNISRFTNKRPVIVWGIADECNDQEILREMVNHFNNPH